MEKIKHEIKNGTSTLVYLNGSTSRGAPMFHRHVIHIDADVDDLELSADEKDVIEKGKLQTGEKMVIYDRHVQLGSRVITRVEDIDDDEKLTKTEKDIIKAARKLEIKT